MLGALLGMMGSACWANYWAMKGWACWVHCMLGALLGDDGLGMLGALLGDEGLGMLGDVGFGGVLELGALQADNRPRLNKSRMARRISDSMTNSNSMGN
jgi:predicted lipid-binding transport protein (Tim44 family)